MNIQIWEKEVSQAIIDNNFTLLRQLYDNAVSDFGKPEADKKWQALISAYDGTAQTG